MRLRRWEVRCGKHGVELDLAQMAGPRGNYTERRCEACDDEAEARTLDEIRRSGEARAERLEEKD